MKLNGIACNWYDAAGKAGSPPFQVKIGGEHVSL